MSDETFEQIERQIASVRRPGSPAELRGAVLGEVHRELLAARWDRRLARVAVALLVLGVGMNVAVGVRSAFEVGRVRQVAVLSSRQSLVDTAVAVAEATDAQTGSRYARQVAAMIGHELTVDDAAAIDAAVRHRASHGVFERKG